MPLVCREPGISRKQTSFVAQEFQERQKGKPQDRRVIALNRIEEMDAGALNAIDSGAAEKSVIGFRHIGFDERLGKPPAT